MDASPENEPHELEPIPPDTDLLAAFQRPARTRPGMDRFSAANRQFHFDEAAPALAHSE